MPSCSAVREAAVALDEGMLGFAGVSGRVFVDLVVVPDLVNFAFPRLLELGEMRRGPLILR